MSLIIICYIFITLIIIYSLFILWKYIAFFKKYKKISNSILLKKDKGVFIAIPCLREQRSIVNTIEHFRRICDLPIVIITTQKENFEYEYNDNYVTTKMIVEKDILNKYNDIYLVDYPFTNGYMADQLNFMLEHLKDLDFYDDRKKWYMSLYNADSKPSKNTFSLIFSCINKNENVIQQYSYCFKNFNNLDFISKGFAIYQSNFEIKVGLFNSSLSYKFLYNYVVGHGLTIDLQTLQKLGNFNTDFWCEDIYLTMRLKYNDIKIVPVLELENIENRKLQKGAFTFNSINPIINGCLNHALNNLKKYKSQAVDILKFGILHNEKIKNSLNPQKEMYHSYKTNELGGIYDNENNIVDVAIFVKKQDINDVDIKVLVEKLPKIGNLY